MKIFEKLNKYFKDKFWIFLIITAAFHGLVALLLSLLFFDNIYNEVIFIVSYVLWVFHFIIGYVRIVIWPGLKNTLERE